MAHINKKFSAVVVMLFILAASIIISGCAPLLIGAGAVGGYHVAKEH